MCLLGARWVVLMGIFQESNSSIHVRWLPLECLGRLASHFGENLGLFIRERLLNCHPRVAAELPCRNCAQYSDYSSNQSCACAVHSFGHRGKGGCDRACNSNVGAGRITVICDQPRLLFRHFPRWRLGLQLLFATKCPRFGCYPSVEWLRFPCYSRLTRRLG